jgi:cytidine deaminase
VTEDLIAAAREAMSRAYAPYSNFPVGAALRAGNGKIYSGCNVENAAYPEGLCAEASAIAAMVGDGAQQIVEVCVMGQGEPLVTPCGGCRQKIREFAAGSAAIHVCGPQGIRKTVTLEELLPLSFGPGHLK